MGGAPNYAKGRANMARMADGKSRAFAQNIIVDRGKGRYPKCLTLEPKPYYFCPKGKAPEDPKDVPTECKSCQEYTRSHFWEENTRNDRLKRLRDAGLPTRIEG